MKKIFLLIIFNLSLSIGFSQWQPANNGLYGGYIYEITVDPTTNYLYAGTREGGIYLSTDNGSSWTSANSGLSVNSLDVKSIAISGDNIFAGTSRGVYLSTNNGDSWIAVNTVYQVQVYLCIH